MVTTLFGITVFVKVQCVDTLHHPKSVIQRHSLHGLGLVLYFVFTSKVFSPSIMCRNSSMSPYMVTNLFRITLFVKVQCDDTLHHPKSFIQQHSLHGSAYDIFIFVYIKILTVYRIFFLKPIWELNMPWLLWFHALRAHSRNPLVFCL